MEVDKFGIGIPGRNMTSGDWLLTNIIPASQLEQICLEFCRAMLILAFFFFLGKKKNSLKSHGFLHNEGGRKFEFFFFFLQNPRPWTNGEEVIPQGSLACKWSPGTDQAEENAGKREWRWECRSRQDPHRLRVCLGFYTYSESNWEPVASLGSHVMRPHVRSWSLSS